MHVHRHITNDPCIEDVHLQSLRKKRGVQSIAHYRTPDYQRVRALMKPRYRLANDTDDAGGFTRYWLIFPVSSVTALLNRGKITTHRRPHYAYPLFLSLLEL
jgi:hypothetical protein